MNLQKRVVGILTNPTGEWEAIAAEKDDIASIYRNYIALLAAIPAVCIFLGLSMMGGPLFGFRTALRTGIATYVSGLIAPIIAAVVIERLAPKFRSSGNTVQALKLVAYASTPMWIAGIFYLFLTLAPLVAIAGLYAIYLFYLGLPPVMKTPLETVAPFMAVSVITILVVYITLSYAIRVFGLPYYAF